MKTPPPVRDSRDDDVPAIQSIYAHHVRHGTGTFELDAPGVEEIRARRADVLANGFPYLVAQRSGAVVGFAYANYFRMRPAYRFTVEDSIYVAPPLAGRGIGKALLSHLIDECESRGFRQMLAVIGDSANAASIGLHRACGFELKCTLDAFGFKFGRWVDSVLMQRALGHGQSSLPHGRS